MTCFRERVLEQINDPREKPWWLDLKGEHHRCPADDVWLIDEDRSVTVTFCVQDPNTHDEIWHLAPLVLEDVREPVVVDGDKYKGEPAEPRSISWRALCRQYPRMLLRVREWNVQGDVDIEGVSWPGQSESLASL